MAPDNSRALALRHRTANFTGYTTPQLQTKLSDVVRLVLLHIIRCSTWNSFISILSLSVSVQKQVLSAFHPSPTCIYIQP
jgi:hypothetical protein